MYFSARIHMRTILFGVNSLCVLLGALTPDTHALSTLLSCRSAHHQMTPWVRTFDVVYIQY